MSPVIISLIAWAPFILLFLIFGIVYPIFGYKRGAARAGISVAVTAISTVLSVILAKLLSGSVAGVIRPIINDMLSEMGEGALGGAAVTDIAMGLASAICSLVLFIPVFILVASVLKPVTGVIVKRFIKAPKHIANKLGGMFISFVDAFLVALLILLPLYGTLFVAKGAAPLLEDQKEIYPYVSAATDPFIVDVAGVPPFATVYDSLMSFEVGGSDFNLSKTLKQILTIVNSIKSIESPEDILSDPDLMKTIISADPEVIKTMKSALSENLLGGEEMGEMGEVITNVVDVVFDSLIELKLEGKEAEKEAEALCGMMSVLVNVVKNPSESASLEESADELIRCCAESKILENTLEALTEGGQSDPTGIFSELGDEVKDGLKDKIDSYISENGSSDTLDALKLFMGIQ